MDNRKKRGANHKGILPIRVIMLSAGITLLGLLGLFALSYYINVIQHEYNNIVKKDYENLEYVNQISQTFYKHQALVFQYMTSMDDDKRSGYIEKRSSELQYEIEKVDKLFGESVIGTTYETEYHDIHAGLNGYFRNVSYIYELNDAGDTSTADYYMENNLSDSIDDVIDCVDQLNYLITQDANVSQQNLSTRLNRFKSSEWILIITLVVIALVGYSRCIRITYDIVNKDALTQVYNTGKTGRDVSRLLKKGKLDGYICICSNIKGLSLVNRRFGTNVGDRALRKFAASMKQAVNNDELMARVGGDNFMFIVRQEREEELLKLLEKVSVPVETDDGVVVLNLENRCGIYVIESTDTFGGILDAAYLAVHQAKQPSLPDNIWYDKELLQKVFERKNILTQYRKGVLNKEFVAYYQPKVSMKDNTLHGCEALVRWQQGDQLVPPFKFIPLLEDEGSITDLDFYIFENVCSDIRKWIDAGITPVRTSSNFSKLHLRNRDFAEHVLEIIGRYEVPHEYIEVELTESSGYEDFQALKDFVGVMNANNIYVSIDDFGTGYSSLSLLKDLNVNVVKLDKSFIDGIGSGDVTNENLVKNVIHMIRDLNRDIICEGVETEVQAQFLKDMDCYMVQGYLYDKPLPHDEFEKRLVNPHYEI